MSEPGLLHQKIGRLIVGKVQGFELTPEEKQALKEGTISGVTLFQENARDLEQLLSLVWAIRKNYPGTPLIAVDQEGGTVQRFDKILSPLPSAMSLAAGGDLTRAASLSEACAYQLSLLGLNCCLAPVLDICTNPLNPVIGTRSFGDDPACIQEYALRVTRAFRSQGIIAVGKHFPGHGDTLEDSHSLLAINKVDIKLIQQRELAPFRGCAPELPSLLTGHIWIPSVDTQPLPASLSPGITSGLLRQHLNYNGLVMTDDLLMKAITETWGLGEAAVMAVLAGADQVLVCGTTGDAQEVHAALLAAVQSGRISLDRLEASLSRVQHALDSIDNMQKERQKLSPSMRLKQLQESISATNQIALESAAAAITILRGSIAAIESGPWVVMAPDHPRYKIDLAQHLQNIFKTAGHTGVTITEKRYPLNPTEADCLPIADYCANSNCLFVTFRALLNKGQGHLGRILSQSGKQRISLAADVPYDFLGLPDWDNCLSTYDPSDLAMQAASLVLSGQKKATGRCPVSWHNI